MTTDDFPGRSEEPRPRSFSSTLPPEVPDQEIAQVRDVSFPIVMRGYDRTAVDAYVTRVNSIIAELQVSRSPQSAIRHALDQVGEETRGILERAHETAEEIAARSRSQAADRVDRAEQEARALVADARVERVDVVVSDAALRVISEELQLSGRSAVVEKLLGGTSDKVAQHPEGDIGANVASGSYASAGMIVLPCTMGTLAGGYLPGLWGDNGLTVVSLVTSALGGVAGLWLALRLQA
jgi:DivIVA domain-containing protein